MPSVTVVHPRGETTRSVSSLTELNAYVINRGWSVQAGSYPDAYLAVTGQPYAAPAADGRPVAFIAPAVVAPAATGVAATDTAALQAAIAATPVGGKLYIPNGVYALNATLTLTNHITIEGEASTAAYRNATGGGPPQWPGATPYLTGVVLRMTVPGTDALRLVGSGKSYNLANFGVLFDSTLATTGHGINGTPTQTYTDGLDYGPTDCKWSNLSVYGHDGNHYAYVLANFQYVEHYGLRSYHGGGFLFVGDGTTENWGNLVSINPYVVLTKTGSASGYEFNSVKAWPAGGSLNLMTFVRPQCNVLGAALTAGTQYAWNERRGAAVGPMTVIGPDFEGGNPVASSAKTSWIGYLFGVSNNWTAVGNDTLPFGKVGVAVGGNALQAVTTGTHNVAIGNSAQSKTTTGSNNIAVGDTVMYNGAALTGSHNVGVGHQALFNATSGSSNMAAGKEAAYSITTGSNNIAVGDGALRSVTTSNLSTAVGAQAGYNATGQSNVFVGQNAVAGVAGSTTGPNTVAVGQNALTALTSGGSNVAVGQGAGVTVTSANATTTGSNSVYLGRNSGQASATQRNDAVAVGYQALVDGNNAVAIGSGVTATAAGAVAIGKDSAGTAAASSTTDEMALGTALHRVKVAGRLNVAPRTPTGSADTQGALGDITADDGFVYVKTSTGWKRSALAAF
jgi:Head domain of trimeric autotransporter adhesin